jgi:hypothetical protein
MMSTDNKDVPQVADAIWGAERADDGVRGIRAVTKGIVRLE